MARVLGEGQWEIRNGGDSGGNNEEYAMDRHTFLYFPLFKHFVPMKAIAELIDEDHAI